MALIDIRHRLPLNELWGGRTIGYRSETRYVTWHFNGGTVLAHRQSGEPLIEWLRAVAAWHMRPGWSNTPNGADGLCYHAVAGADGNAYVTRDTDAILWHSGSSEGNTKSLALLFPLGEGQAVPAAMLDAAYQITDAWLEWYGLRQDAVRGHQEWTKTTCPGEAVMKHVKAYRAGSNRSAAGMYRNTYPCTVRTAPSRTGSIVRSYPAGSHLAMQGVVDGQQIAGSSRWFHLESAEGFIHDSAGFVRL